MKITGLRIQTDRRQTIWLFKIVTDKLNSGVSLRQIQLAVTAGFERGASGSKFSALTTGSRGDVFVVRTSKPVENL